MTTTITKCAERRGRVKRWREESTVESIHADSRAAGELAARAHRVEGRRDDLRRPRALRVVRRRQLQELGVGQDDPQLIVQTVEQNAELGALRRRARPVVCRQRGYTHACVPADGALSLSEDCELADAGSRHNVSAKIRIEPPAVRTYSTFPAEIQL